MNKYWSTILLLMVCLTAFGQQNVLNESFVIRKNRNLTLPVAERVYFPASAPDQTIDQKFELTFDSIAVDVYVDVQLPEVIPARLESKQSPPQIGRHYLKLGAGSLISSLIQYQYINPLEQKRRISFGAIHEGYANGPVRGAGSGENIQMIDFHLTQPWKNSSFIWKSNFDRYQFNYYGLPDSLYYGIDRNLQIVDDVRVRLANGIQFKSAINEDLNSMISIDHLLTHTTNLQNNENIIDLKAQLDYKINDKYKLYQTVDFSSIGYQSKLDNNRTIFRSSTYLRSGFKNLIVEGGMDFFLIDSISGLGKQSFLIPKISFQTQYNKQDFTLSYQGDSDNQSLYQLSNLNPYLSDSLLFRTSLSKGIWSLGYSYDYHANHKLLAQVSYATIRNQAFLVNNFSHPNTFDLRYDSADIGRLMFNVSLQGSFSEQWSYQLDGAYQQFYLETLSSPYHMPKSMASLKVGYKPIPQLQLYTSFHLLNGISNPGYILNDLKPMDNVIDWRFSAYWQLNKKITAYTELYNLLNQSNSRYYLYPTRPLMVRFGVLIHF